MSIYEIGRLCMKLAGRDAGRKCVIVENVNDKFVVIDGNVRRKKVNIKHLEPFADIIEIKDKASHEDVKAAFTKLGLAVWDKKSKKSTERPKQIRKKKEKVAEETSKKGKKAEKIEAKKVEVVEKEAEAKEKSAEKKVEKTTETKEPSIEEAVDSEETESKE